jgi:hypothetical protein
MHAIARVFASSHQRALVGLLGVAYGDPSNAERALARALADGEGTLLPDTAHELYEFVARRMVARLTRDLGPQVTLALLEDLASLRDVAGHAPTMRPISSQNVPRAGGVAPEPRGSTLPPGALLTHHGRHGVLLVECDPAQRIAIARAFIRARYDVTPVTSAEEAGAALDEADYVGGASVQTVIGRRALVTGLVPSCSSVSVFVHSYAATTPFALAS